MNDIPGWANFTTINALKVAYGELLDVLATSPTNDHLSRDALGNEVALVPTYGTSSASALGRSNAGVSTRRVRIDARDIVMRPHTS